MKNVLVIAPHADDETLGCGATMAKLSGQGCNVFVLIATNASVGAPELFDAELIAKVRAEAKNAHKILGVKETLFMEFPAPALDQFPIYKIAGEFAKVIKANTIDTVFIPHRGDCHKDHGVIHDAAMVACRPIGNCPVKAVYAYETLSETEWGEPTEPFVPAMYITFDKDTFNKKLQALSFFQSQLQEFPAPRSLEAIETLAKFRGSTVSAPRAEAFEILREIR